MPLTNAGRNRLLTSGVEFAFVQFSTQAVADAAIPGLTALAGVQATVAVDQLIVGPETNWTGVDREPTRDYRGVRTAGVWDRDPTQAGAVLLAVEHTPSMPDKVLNQSLRISGSLLLTNDQAANITRNVLQVGGATETDFGLVRLGTQADINAERGDGAVTGSRLAAWWNQLAVPVSKVSGLAATLASYATNAALALKANLNSPALTGNPTAPTPRRGDNDTSIATTAFVQGAGPQVLYNDANGGTRVTLSESMANFSLILVTVATTTGTNRNITATFRRSSIPTTRTNNFGLQIGATTYQIWGSGTTLNCARDIRAVIGFP